MGNDNSCSRITADLLIAFLDKSRILTPRGTRDEDVFPVQIKVLCEAYDKIFETVAKNFVFEEVVYEEEDETEKEEDKDEADEEEE